MARVRVEIEMDECSDGLSLRRSALRLFVHNEKEWKLAYEDTHRARKQTHTRACWENAIPMVVADAAKRLDTVDLGVYCDEALGIERDDD